MHRNPRPKLNPSSNLRRADVLVGTANEKANEISVNDAPLTF
jgi:hypothetical protein